MERQNSSHPTMGAWIEIFLMPPAISAIRCRTPRWVRGLKSSEQMKGMRQGLCRTPRWVRGLKYISSEEEEAVVSRTPRWVRGLKYRGLIQHLSVILSHPTMGAWIEIYLIKFCFWNSQMSHPTMGAWIEIVSCLTVTRLNSVAPHDGCVD